jgi:hypothetical protein
MKPERLCCQGRGDAAGHNCDLFFALQLSARSCGSVLPIKIFCVHDAAGTMIYQTLQEETKARRARKVEIVNLGLEPWEGIAMDLEVERGSAE